MIVHYDKEERKDLVFTIKEGENNHIEIIIDQQRPPCGDFKQIGHYAVPVPIAHGDLRSISYARMNHPKLYETIMKKHGLEDMFKRLEEARAK